MDTKEFIEKEYGGRIRVRVCGVCELDGQFLLINHLGINTHGDFWNAPGGGLEFGETLENCLKREFLEETGLVVELVEFLDVFEFIRPPLHAVEFFYKVHIVGGHLKLGHDPETKDRPIMDEAKWLFVSDFKNFKKEEIHTYFHKFL